MTILGSHNPGVVAWSVAEDIPGLLDKGSSVCLIHPSPLLQVARVENQLA